jgi:molybdenum cofactor biosynthesis protein B
MSTKEHKKTAPKRVNLGILTISTSRTLETDQSGQWIRKQAEIEGHQVLSHTVVPDDASAIVQTLSAAMAEQPLQAMLLTGGTGISSSDVTIEAVRPLLQKELSAFGCLFAQLSYGEIGSAALMSRAMAGIVGDVAVFCIPGSLAACKLACRELVFPELGHLTRHIHSG